MIQRTVWLHERMTTVEVSTLFLREADAVEQGAVGDAGGGEEHVAGGELVGRVFAVGVGDAHAAGALLFSSVSRIRRPCIWPPMQRSAAAASTPSGAPPEPR